MFSAALISHGRIGVSFNTDVSFIPKAIFSAPVLVKLCIACDNSF